MKIAKRKNKLIKRIGAKDNDIKFFIHLLPENVETVIEPFGGSFAVCRRVYCDDKYKKHVNDTDNELFYLYNNPHELKEISEYINSLINDKINNSEIKKIVKDKYEDSPFYNYIMNNYFLRGSICKKTPTEQYNDDEYEKMQKYTFTDSDYKDILEQYKNDESAFIFLDPPYLFSDNSAYKSQNIKTDMTDILCHVKEFMEDINTKCKVMLIINKLNIIEYLFKNFIKGEYQITYQLSKRKDCHLIITNYD